MAKKAKKKAMKARAGKAKAKKATKAKKPVKRAKAKPAAKARKAAPKAKKRAKAQAEPPRSGVIAPANGILLGYVDDYFAKIGVIALTLEQPLSIGSRIHIIGHTTNFEQVVDSMQIEHAPVTDAAAKAGVGIKVTTRARAGDHVYLIP